MTALATPMDELTECRNTIGRMDTLLEDLRKYGFSLVTGLLTASSLVGASSGLAALPLAAIAIMVLVLALFGIDMYYQVVLSAAVGRAMDLEACTHDPEIRVTSSVSRNATLTHATSTVFFLYAALLLVSMGMGLFGAERVAPRYLVGIVAGVALTLMLAYWLYVRAVTLLNKPKPRVMGVLRVGYPATVTVIGSGFHRATRVTTDIPGADIRMVKEPGQGGARYMDRRRDRFRATVDGLGMSAVGTHTLHVLAQGDRPLGDAECLVVAQRPGEDRL